MKNTERSTKKIKGLPISKVLELLKIKAEKKKKLLHENLHKSTCT